MRPLTRCRSAPEVHSGFRSTPAVYPQMCFHTSVDHTEARNRLPGYFGANSLVGKSRPIAPPQREDAVDTGAGPLREGVLGPFRVAGVVAGIRELLRESDALVESAEGQPG